MNYASDDVHTSSEHVQANNSSSTTAVNGEVCAPSESKLNLCEWLNKPMKVLLTDKRTIVGDLLCTDNAPNIILSWSREFWLNEQGKLDDGDESRFVGLVMIPAHTIVSISVPEMNDFQLHT